MVVACGADHAERGDCSAAAKDTAWTIIGAGGAAGGFAIHYVPVDRILRGRQLDGADELSGVLVLSGPDRCIAW